MNSSLISRLAEYSRYAEMKQVAYNVAALQREKMFNALAVLSLYPQEGRTFVCATLGMAYAEASGKKVLVIDTTTFQNPDSLKAQECVNGMTPLVEVRTLRELKTPQTASPLREKKMPPLQATVVYERPPLLPVLRQNDFSLIQELVDEQATQYGLVLIDTAPLMARNKNNVDPRLVARVAGASLLVMGRASLTVSLVDHLPQLKDPSLHLIGVISNEEKPL